MIAKEKMYDLLGRVYHIEKLYEENILPDESRDESITKFNFNAHVSYLYKEIMLLRRRLSDIVDPY